MNRKQTAMDFVLDCIYCFLMTFTVLGLVALNLVAMPITYWKGYWLDVTKGFKFSVTKRGTTIWESKPFWER